MESNLAISARDYLVQSLFTSTMIPDGDLEEHFVAENFGILNTSYPCSNATLADGECFNMPVCGYCYDMGMTKAISKPYELFNMLIIGIILPLTGIFGLVGNCLSAFVYSRRTMRSSINVYLFVLALSDITIIITSFFLFFCESMRKRSAFASKSFALFAPVMFPLGMSAQSMSVFLTVAAAIDGFVLVASTSLKDKFCTPRAAKYIAIFVLLTALSFNFPHWFEIELINCWSVPSQKATYDVCPTDLRQSAFYYEIYYAYLYTIFMAAGPVLLLIVLNCAIFIILKKKGSSENDSDILTLVLIVCLFIACNIMPLTVNFLELMLNMVNTYLIDLSNCMVVMNSSCNFLIYFAFGKQFRRTLKNELGYFLKRKRVVKFADELVPVDYIIDKNTDEDLFLRSNQV